ncbi:GNAT family N-acetyltransferase [Litchfieldella qijiaojingensis]|uniref:GNAT family N-acetyltransferase n=1 Tax=Litchfieldella qijiaojingensis TaxID=980347 RepID=UPI001E47659E|nr:GNAT family N-acetyltransferase [Halomonas qijiaojingensis]
MSVSNEMSKRLQTYELTIRDIQEADIDKLHQLSVGVGWPHRPDDWRLLLQLGKGYVGCDEIGRIVGSAMWFPMGDNFVTIGMVITSPRLQALGAGRWLMEHVMRECSGRHIQLNAPQAAHRLYESLAFKPVAVVHQHQGEAVDPGEVPMPAGAQIRTLAATDLVDMAQLDKAAFGADRTTILAALLDRSNSTVLIRDGGMAGFALCRKFGRGHVVGPVVARDAADAIALTAPHVAAHAGSFLRVDTAQTMGGFTDFLNHCGLSEFDRVTTMSREPRPQEDTGVYTFALAGHTIG